MSLYFPIKETQKDIDVLYVGRHIEIKGIQYIIKAANLLKEQGTQVHISIAVSYTHLDVYKRQVRESA